MNRTIKALFIFGISVLLMGAAASTSLVYVTTSTRAITGNLVVGTGTSITTTGTGSISGANITATAVAVGNITGAGTGVLTALATPSSANLISAVTDETGTGALVFANTPTLITPVLGAATGTSLALSGALTTNSISATSDLYINKPTANALVFQASGAEIARFAATTHAFSLAGTVTASGTGTHTFGTTATVTLSGGVITSLPPTATPVALRLRRLDTSLGGLIAHTDQTDTIKARAGISNTNNDYIIDDGTTARITVSNSTGNVTLTNNLTVNGTGTSSFAGDLTVTGGNVGVGGAADAQVALYLKSTALTGTGQYGLISQPTFSSAATTSGNGAYIQFTTAAAAFTMVDGRGLWLAAPTIGAASAITNYTGLFVPNQGAAGITNAYGIDIAAQSGAATTNVGLRNAGTTILGSSGTAISAIRSASATLNFGSIAAAASEDLTITVTGAAVGDSVSHGLPAAPAAGIMFNAFVSATNTVTVRATNITGSPVDPASATYRATVISF